MLVPGNEPNDQSVRKGPCMTPGANPHADATVRADFTPVIKAGLGVEFPFECAFELFGFIIFGNRVRGAAICAFLTQPAKILHAYINRMVGYQRQVRGNRAQPEPGPQLFCHEIT